MRFVFGDTERVTLDYPQSNFYVLVILYFIFLKASLLQREIDLDTLCTFLPFSEGETVMIFYLHSLKLKLF